MRDLRDLKADWRRWSKSERIFGLFTLATIFVGASLPYILAA